MDIKIESISVFFLCYNDKHTIGKLIEDSLKILPQLADQYEVVVIDDGSNDGSGDLLDEFAKKYNNLRIASHKKNKGYGAAVKAGFSVCKNDLVFYTDGDGQYDFNEIAKLLPLINKTDVVNGFLKKRCDSCCRIILGKIYQELLCLLFRIPIKYVDCDFRIFKKYVIDNIYLESDGGFICAEMIKKIIDKGYKIEEAEINHYPRANGASKFFNIYNVCKLIFDCFRFYVILQFNKVIVKHG